VHASPDKDDGAMHRVRCDGRLENLTVTATNRFTAGMAIASIEDNHDGELSEFDLSPTDVKEILALFPGRRANDDDVGDTVRIDVDVEHFTITDTGGLFEGKSLTLPRQPQSPGFPDIPMVISRTLARRPSKTPRLIANGVLVGVFSIAARAYGRELTFEPTGTSSTLVIGCGESFLGLLMPIRIDDGRPRSSTTGGRAGCAGCPPRTRCPVRACGRWSTSPAPPRNRSPTARSRPRR
jgi:hypothetical protein